MHLDDENLKTCVWILLHTLGLHSSWRPVEELKRLGVIRTMYFLVGIANSWNGGSKIEILKMSLDVSCFMFQLFAALNRSRLIHLLVIGFFYSHLIEMIEMNYFFFNSFSSTAVENNSQ